MTKLPRYRIGSKMTTSPPNQDLLVWGIPQAGYAGSIGVQVRFWVLGLCSNLPHIIGGISKQ